MTTATPWRLPSASATTGIPPPPTVTTTTPAAIEASDRGELDDAKRLRRRHDSPVAAIHVVYDVPIPPAAPVGLLLVHEPADGLCRAGERGIVSCNHDLRDDGCNVLVDSAMVELVLKRLLQLVPDGTLGVSSADVERHFVHALRGQLGSAKDESHLRPVAMTDGEVPARLDHVDEVVAVSWTALYWSSTV